MKFYDWESIIDFGKCKGQSISKIFEENPKYINWCFQMIDWFCVSDEIFENLPIIKFLRTNSKKDKQTIEMLNKLVSLHKSKHQILDAIDYNYYENNLDDFRNDNFDWLKEASGTDDPEVMNDVYWNLD